MTMPVFMKAANNGSDNSQVRGRNMNTEDKGKTKSVLRIAWSRTGTFHGEFGLSDWRLSPFSMASGVRRRTG